jgi:glycine/D-amino acid oxidase-like deaminating enzyme
MRIVDGLFLIGGEEGRVTARTPNPERTSQRRYTRLRDQFLELFPQLQEDGITMRRVENQWNSFISYSKNRRDRLPLVEYADGGNVAIIHSVTAAGLVKSFTISKVLAGMMEAKPLYSLPKYADLIDARRQGRF